MGQEYLGCSYVVVDQDRPRPRWTIPTAAHPRIAAKAAVTLLMIARLKRSEAYLSLKALVN
jgi:hypothetical protein